MHTNDNSTKIIPLFSEYKKHSFHDFEAIMNGKKVDQEITERKDVFGMYSTLFALNRTKRPQPSVKPVEKGAQQCIFDSLDVVAKPIIPFAEKEVYVYPSLFLIDRETYAVPNAFAFNTGDHEVIFTKEHIEFIKDIRKEHIKGLLSVLAQRSEFMLGHEGVDQLSAGINFGTNELPHSAGASQPHLHAQLGAIYKEGFLPDADMMYKRIKETGISSGDFLSLYCKENKNRGLEIAETESFVVFSPFAPRFKDEVHIISKGMMHIIDLKKEELAEELSFLFYRILVSLAQLGVEAFNVEFLQDRFSKEYEGFFLIKIMPRQGEIAYSELSGRYVVDRFSEQTAEMIRASIG